MIIFSEIFLFSFVPILVVYDGKTNGDIYYYYIYPHYNSIECSLLMVWLCSNGIYLSFFWNASVSRIFMYCERTNESCCFLTSRLLQRTVQFEWSKCLFNQALKSWFLKLFSMILIAQSTRYKICISVIHVSKIWSFVGVMFTVQSFNIFFFLTWCSWILSFECCSMFWELKRKTIFLVYNCQRLLVVSFNVMGAAFND